MHQTQFSENIPYGGFSQIQSHIEVNPGPKTMTNRRTAKSRFLFDLNTDASLAHSDPNLATKYLFEGGLVIVYH